MDDESPAMEDITNEMREVLREWIEHPEDTALKDRYNQLHAVYQKLFLLEKGSDWQSTGKDSAEGEAVAAQ